MARRQPHRRHDAIDAMLPDLVDDVVGLALVIEREQQDVQTRARSKRAAELAVNSGLKPMLATITATMLDRWVIRLRAIALGR